MKKIWSLGLAAFFFAISVVAFSTVFLQLHLQHQCEDSVPGAKCSFVWNQRGLKGEIESLMISSETGAVPSQVSLNAREIWAEIPYSVVWSYVGSLLKGQRRPLLQLLSTLSIGRGKMINGDDEAAWHLEIENLDLSRSYRDGESQIDLRGKITLSSRDLKPLLADLTGSLEIAEEASFPVRSFELRLIPRHFLLRESTHVVCRGSVEIWSCRGSLGSAAHQVLDGLFQEDRLSSWPLHSVEGQLTFEIDWSQPERLFRFQADSSDLAVVLDLQKAFASELRAWDPDLYGGAVSLSAVAARNAVARSRSLQNLGLGFDPASGQVYFRRQRHLHKGKVHFSVQGTPENIWDLSGSDLRDHASQFSFQTQESPSLSISGWHDTNSSDKRSGKFVLSEPAELADARSIELELRWAALREKPRLSLSPAEQRRLMQEILSANLQDGVEITVPSQEEIKTLENVGKTWLRGLLTKIDQKATEEEKQKAEEDVQRTEKVLKDALNKFLGK